MEIKLSLLIELKNITKLYKTGGCVYSALNNVSCTIHQGEMVAIMGSSGSGKSTLMNIIGFLDRVTDGDYFFSGRHVSQLAEIDLSNIRNKKIGFIFQSFFLLPRLSVLQNVMLPLLYRGVKKEISRAKAYDILEKLNMSKFQKHKPEQLSGGQQQRIAIARALVGDPELILADEPTGALDSKTGKEVMDLLVELNTQNSCSIVVITHDKDVSQMCQRVIALKDGRVML